jgi:hygromycin-B 4-O-kinase
MQEPAKHSPERVAEVLGEILGDEVTDVAPLGAGAWSRAYGFTRRTDGGKLVARLGQYIDDFEADRDAMAFTASKLPVPRTITIASTRDYGIDGYISISERAEGEFPEELDGDRWRRVLPAWSAMMGALWSNRPEDWSPQLRDRFGADTPWTDWLLSIADEPEGARNHGWRDKLAASPGGFAAFDKGFTALQDLARTDAVANAERAMMHRDLINRNVLVAENRVTAVFDWGCGLVGDPLFDLVWLEFWAPWHPGIAAIDPRTAFAPLIAELGHSAADIEKRWQACGIHIGLDHLGYHAFIDDQEALARTTARLADYL